MQIINYEVNNMTVMNTYGLGFTGKNGIISCVGTDDCTVIVGGRSYSSYSTTHLYAYHFNTTNMTAGTHLLTTTNPSSSSYVVAYCFSSIPHAETYDIDGDGTTNYIFTTFLTSSITDDKINLLSIQYNGTHMELSDSVNFAGVSDTRTGNYDCTTNDNLAERFITSPLTHNWDGFGSNGYETVFGYMKDSDEFKIRMYDNELNLEDTFPTVLDADGIIVSNVIRANIFTDTNEDDFCVMGFQSTTEEIDLLCGSKQTSGIESKEFIYDTSGMGNILLGDTIMNNHIQAGEYNTVYIDGANIDEIISPYGIFEVSYEGTNHLELLFETPDVETGVVSTDFNGDSRQDLFFLGETLLHYLMDGYVNNNIELTGTAYIDPMNPICVDKNAIIHMDLVDDDNDDATCHIKESYINGTFIENVTSRTTNTPKEDFKLYYSTDQQGTFTLTIHCKDTNHSYEELMDFVVIVNNESTCNEPNKGLIEVIEYTPDEGEDAGAEVGLTEDEIAETIGIIFTSNSRLKLILGLAIIIIFMVRMASYSHNGMAILGAGFIGLILACGLTLVDTWIMILIIVVLGLVAILGKHIMGSDPNSG